MVVMIRGVAANRLPRRVFLVLWGIALVRLLVPVTFAMPFGIPTGLTDGMLVGRNADTLESSNSVEGVVGAAIESAGGSMESAVSNGHGSGGAWAASGDGDSAAYALPENGTIVVLWTAAVLWAAVAVCLALYFLVNWIRCRKEFRTSSPVRNDFVAAWLQEHPLCRRIKVRQVVGLSTPLTYGILRPVILVPGNVDWGNEGQMQYVLFHEYIHIRHFDSLWKGVAAAALCIHWFNPMAWLLYLLLNRDIELECDEYVVRRFGQEQRKEYAKVLLQLEGKRSGFVLPGNFFSRNLTEERIKAIMESKKKGLAAFVLMVVLTASCTVFVFAAPVEQDVGKTEDLEREHQELEGQEEPGGQKESGEQPEPGEQPGSGNQSVSREMVDEALEGYRDFFGEKHIPESRYRFFDLDSSGVPEMILEFLNERTHNETYAIATWHDGSAHWITLGLFPPNVITDADCFSLEVDLMEDRPLIKVSAFGEDDRYTEEGNVFYYISGDEFKNVFCSIYFLDKDSGEEKILYKVNAVHEMTKEEYDGYSDTYHIPPEFYDLFQTLDMDGVKKTDWYEEIEDAIAAYKSLLE